jgi:putative membrane protein
LEAGSLQAATFTAMERRLLGAIMTPAMVVAWLAGLALVYFGGWEGAHWLWAKLILVLAMSGLHGWLAAQQRAFAESRNRHSARTYRLVNEIPTVLLILIVVLVVVKPF